MSDARMTRRRLLRSGAVAGAGAAIAGLPAGSALASRRRRRRRDADVVVVGAGFAGLTAALRIKQAGHSVIVLEARDRVGGRAFNRPIGGGEISERGATFVGPTQNHILDARAASSGSTSSPPSTTATTSTSTPRGSEAPTATRGRSGRAPPDPAILPDLAHAVLTLDQMSTEVPVDAPWTSSSAAEWDEQTLAELGRRTSSTTAPVPQAGARSRPGRSSAPSRASCRCSSRSSTSPPRATRATRAPSSATSTPATARRCGASSAALSAIPLKMARELGNRVRPATRPVQHDRPGHGTGGRDSDGHRR